MPDNLPVNQVLGVIDGDSGKVFKRAGSEEVVGSDAANGGVWVEAREDWIAVRH